MFGRLVLLGCGKDLSKLRRGRLEVGVGGPGGGPKRSVGVKAVNDDSF